MSKFQGENYNRSHNSSDCPWSRSRSWPLLQTQNYNRTSRSLKNGECRKQRIHQDPIHINQGEKLHELGRSHKSYGNTGA